MRDKAETYELPKNRAVDVLVNTVINDQIAIRQCEDDVVALLEKTELPFESMTKHVDRIKECRARIKECKTAIGWIYERIMGTE